MPALFGSSSASSRHAAVSASATYALLLAGSGVYLPFFPLWLAARGLDGVEIGIVLALPMVMRVVASAPLARLGDGVLGPRRTFLVMGCGAALAYAALSLTASFWPIAIVILVVSAFLAPTMPLLDVIVLQGVLRHGHDYGRIRQWGSISWLVASIGGGVFLSSFAVEALPPLLALLAALTVFSALALPDDRGAAPPREATAAGDRTPVPLVFALLCVGVACLQGAHGFVYSFGTVIFQAAGFSSTEIGFLWAVGVVVEILLFLFAGSWVGRIGPYGMISIGAVAGMVRWSLMALDPRSGLVLGGLQAMHGLSFAAVHLGTIGWVARFAGDRSTRQGIIASAVGAGLSAGTGVAGWLFETFGAGGYAAMAAAAAAGLGFILLARTLERRSGLSG